jgi:hypothetical protein
MSNTVFPVPLRVNGGANTVTVVEPTPDAVALETVTRDVIVPAVVETQNRSVARRHHEVTFIQRGTPYRNAMWIGEGTEDPRQHRFSRSLLALQFEHRVRPFWLIRPKERLDEQCPVKPFHVHEFAQLVNRPAANRIRERQHPLWLAKVNRRSWNNAPTGWRDLDCTPPLVP